MRVDLRMVFLVELSRLPALRHERAKTVQGAGLQRLCVRSDQLAGRLPLLGHRAPGGSDQTPWYGEEIEV